MVSFKPENTKPSASVVAEAIQRHDTPPYARHGAFLLMLMGMVLAILFVAQVWTFYFLYGKLSDLEIEKQQPKTSLRNELRSFLKQELNVYFDDQLNRPKEFSLSQTKRSLRGEGKKSSIEVEAPKVSESSNPQNKFVKSFEDDRPPMGPPIKSLYGKEWLFFTPDEEAIQNNDKSAKIVKRNIPETRYSDAGEEPRLNLQGQLVDEATDQSWLQLTSYARIPYNTIQEFCSRTRASCPAGPQGEKGSKGVRGIMGMKGDRGDRGLPGLRGDMGEIGLPGEKGQPGPRGIKGDRGYPGKNGVDGRDGLPGEPGLDGIPGRHGMDGKDGICSNGRNGMPGKDGQDGRDGMKGSKGHKGESGITGHTGITGPRGRPGNNGIKGESGMPGVTAYKVNGTTSNKLLIAPTLAGISSRKHIKIREHTRLRLACLATGNPRPFVEWTRLDPFPITTGFWKDGTIEGSVLNISHVGRDHTGTYLCEAYNGIGPNAKRFFEINVEFEPYIRVIQWKVGAHLRDSVSLFCHIESFPQAVPYWENQEGRILENSAKYIISYIEDPARKWKSVMNLTILNVSPSDFGNYFCEAKNELSTTRGVVKLHEIDPTRYTPTTGKVEGLSFGPEPPDYGVLFNESCDTSRCCHQTKDKFGVTNLKYCIRVEKAGKKHKKSPDCLLTAVGKPVYQTKTGSGFGSWMVESKPGLRKDRYYRTLRQKPKILYEYGNKEDFRSGNPSQKNNVIKYNLPVKFRGDSHIVYNGVFYYHSEERNEILEYNLYKRNDGVPRSIAIPFLETNFTLYSTGKSFIDLSTDENGVWAIYGLEGTDNTMIMKINETTFTEEFTLNISLSHYNFGEMFITCGILYGIESASEKDTRISLALDLYKENILDIELPFTNPVSSTTILNYNPNTKMLYSWADGTQLTYPIKTEEEEEKKLEF